MPSLAVIGIQWGDEGKGKIIDALTPSADVIVRYQGGANAGHTIVADGRTTVLHLVPSGVLHAGKRCLIGNGVVVDPQALLDEIDGLAAQGVTVTPASLAVSERAHVVMPYHKRLDQLRESLPGGQKIGTTGRGIGPCYADKIARLGVRICDLFDPEHLRRRVESALVEKNLLFRAHSAFDFDVDEVVREAAAYGDRLRPYVADTSRLVDDALDGGEKVVFEGAQGALLDIDFGTYPYVTSSNAGIGGIPVGAGISPARVGRVIGVAKGYATRVGEGPFPSEQRNALGDRLREVGREFGATTGRPRRCGWFDAVAARHAVRFCGVDAIALTKLDVLSGLDELKVAVAYRLGGSVIDRFPASIRDLAAVEPVFETLPGWREALGPAAALGYDGLPAAARDYIAFLEGAVGVPVEMVSVGAGREALLLRTASPWPD